MWVWGGVGQEWMGRSTWGEFPKYHTFDTFHTFGTLGRVSQGGWEIPKTPKRYFSYFAQIPVPEPAKDPITTPGPYMTYDI